MPSATQNELNGKDARTLLAHGCIVMAEGAHMPSTPEAVRLFLEAGIAFGPGKARQCRGRGRLGARDAAERQPRSWTLEHTERRLADIMTRVHASVFKTAEEFGAGGNYVIGANVAGFMKVARAMLAHGLVGPGAPFGVIAIEPMDATLLSVRLRKGRP
jgi:glutamate dehydrogenase (NADP+)